MEKWLLGYLLKQRFGTQLVFDATEMYSILLYEHHVKAGAHCYLVLSGQLSAQLPRTIFSSCSSAGYWADCHPFNVVNTSSKYMIGLDGWASGKGRIKKGKERRKRG